MSKRPIWCNSLFYFTFYVLNMFRTLIYPSSGACDSASELPHPSFCSWFVVCWRFGAVGFEWCPCCRLQAATWAVLLWFDVCWCYVVVWLWWCGIRMQAEALVPQPYHTTPAKPQRNTNTHRTRAIQPMK